MPLTRITRMRNCGVFRDFSWPSNLSDFGKYNLIYGWNGSGKTTLSRLFRALENKAPLPTGEATVAIDGHEIGSSDFPQANLAVRVFNRDFVRESVFPTNGDVAPIFIIGQQNVEKQKEVETLKTRLDASQGALATQRQEKSSAENERDRFCIDQAKGIKDTLRSSGRSAYNNYDKSNFARRAGDMAVAGDHASHRLDDDARNKMLVQHKATLKAKLQPIAYRFPDIQQHFNETFQLLSATVVSAAIAALKDNLPLASWVHQGLGLHRERKADKCLFCTQPFPKDRLAALEAHFSTEYEEFLGRVDQNLTAIQAAAEATVLLLPNPAQVYDDLVTEYEAAKAAVESKLRVVKQSLDLLARALSEKKSRPFEAMRLDGAVAQPDPATIESVNAVITKHNQASDDFQGRIDSARQRLEADSVASNIDRFIELRDAVQTAEKAVETANKEVERIKGEITRLEREIVDHRQPAEELNQDLHSYLGHDELRLETKDAGYAINRRDVRADALSEGETTAIALLYFLKSLQDRRVDLSKTVVVLDDPVSSLDANALYSAFGFIRGRTQDAAQLIILTHNFTFFRQVRNWFHYLKGQKKRNIDQRPARFYMLDCIHKPDGRCASLRWLDHLLERFESEYHYLFSYVHAMATATTPPSLKESYALPNLSRRLLETFLAFRQPQISGELWQKFKLLTFDETKKIRIIRFLHTHSHNSALGEPEHDLSLLSESQAILKDLLDLMKAEDGAHYSAMETLVQNVDTDDSETITEESE
ncbi:MAG: AAA family ATPase [Planctomycetota bacterium]